MKVYFEGWGSEFYIMKHQMYLTRKYLTIEHDKIVIH